MLTLPFGLVRHSAELYVTPHLIVCFIDKEYQTSSMYHLFDFVMVDSTFFSISLASVAGLQTKNVSREVQREQNQLSI